MKNKINIKDTIIFGSDAYGVTSHTKKLSKKRSEELLEGISGELWQVSYIPEWSKRYPMWINRILFWLFNHGLFRKLERYL